jgi:hypothetical protein
MSHVLGTAGAFSLLLLTSACATTRSFESINQERLQLQELHASLTAAGGPSSRDALDPDAVLVSYRYTLGSSLDELQDTIRGADEVGEWLAAWEARPQEAFALVPYDVDHCGTHAIQSGTYPIPGARADDPAVRGFYNAMWTSNGSGRLLLSNIWLSPDASSRPAIRRSGCRSLGRLDGEGRRLILTVEGLFLRARPVEETIVRALRAHGYLQNVVSARGTEGISGTVGATYRVTPRWGLRILYEMVPATFGQGRRGHPFNRQPELLLDDDAFALLGTWELGWVRLGIGPAIAPVTFEWRDFLVNHGALVSSTTQEVLGLMGEMSVQIPGVPWGAPLVSLRYALLGNGDAPGYANVPGFPVKLSRSGVSVGMGFRF